MKTDFSSAILWKSVFWHPLFIFFGTEKNVCVLKTALSLVCWCGWSWTGLVKCSCCHYHWIAMPMTRELNHSQRQFLRYLSFIFSTLKSWAWAWKVNYFICFYYLLWIIMSISLRTDRIEAFLFFYNSHFEAKSGQVGSWLFLNNIHTQLYSMCSCWKKGYYFQVCDIIKI